MPPASPMGECRAVVAQLQLERIPSLAVSQQIGSGVIEKETMKQSLSLRDIIGVVKEKEGERPGSRTQARSTKDSNPEGHGRVVPWKALNQSAVSQCG